MPNYRHSVFSESSLYLSSPVIEKLFRKWTLGRLIQKYLIEKHLITIKSEHSLHFQTCRIFSSLLQPDCTCTTPYLRLFMDKRSTWNLHTCLKRHELKKKNFYLLVTLFDRRSKLILNNKMLIYNALLNSIWTYGHKLRLEFSQAFQNLRTITNSTPYNYSMLHL